MSCEKYNTLYNEITTNAEDAQNARDGSYTPITQEDFATGPLTINKSGVYKFEEDVKLNFYPNLLDICDVKRTGNDFFGFPAGIKITATNVILDLSGHAFYQSVQDFCVQRFFALIQLNDNPFAPKAGPIPNPPCSIKSASNIIIRGKTPNADGDLGVLGLSAHQAILGNTNENIIIENVTIKDFEVTGITLNDVSGVYINNVTVGRSIGCERFLPVSAYWSTLIFNYRLLKLAFIKYYITSVEQNLIININNHIRNILLPFLNIIYKNRTLTCIYKEMEYLSNKVYPYLKFLWNEHKASPCGVHGIKITGPRPSVTKFHQSVNDDPENNKSSDICIMNTSITELLAAVEPSVCVTYNKKPVHTGAGLKLTAEILDIPLIKDLVYTMNILGKNKELNAFLNTSINDDIACFVKTKKNPTGKIGFDGAFDMMGHLNKGVMGLRLGSCENVDLSGVMIFNIRNNGGKLSDDLKKHYLKNYEISQIDFTSDTFLSPMNYHGSYSMGAIISGCDNVAIGNSSNKGLDIYDINAPHGAAVGLAVNNQCNNVAISKTTIYDLISCSSCFDSATFVIDEQSKNVTANNVTFNPASTTP